MGSAKNFLVRLNNYYLLPVEKSTLSGEDPVSLTRDINKAWRLENESANLWAEELGGLVYELGTVERV